MAADPEAEIGQLLEARELGKAATLALDTYGDEVYGFLINHLGTESDAAEVFAQASEDLWKGLESFGARCSMRTWLYVLARHAAARYRRTPWQRRERRTGDSNLDAVIARPRTGTRPWLRTEVKERFGKLRESLDPDDRMLLVLRVDRALAWKDIARITLDTDAPDERALGREVDRLTKRFQLLKDELRQRGRELGLIDPE